MMTMIRKLSLIFIFLTSLYPLVSFGQEQLGPLDVEQPEGWDEELPKIRGVSV